jgi:hypothetical protein
LASRRGRHSPAPPRPGSKADVSEPRRGSGLERVPGHLPWRRKAVSLDLRTLLERLAAGRIEFVLIGGLAVNPWGHVRGTRDIDLVPNPAKENLARLAEALEALGGRVETPDGLLAPGSIRAFLAVGDRTLVTTDMGYVDVLQGMPQIPRFAELDAEAVEVDVAGTPIRVCSLQSLLEMKRASSRLRDRDDLEALETAHSDDPDTESSETEAERDLRRSPRLGRPAVARGSSTTQVGRPQRRAGRASRGRGRRAASRPGLGGRHSAGRVGATSRSCALPRAGQIRKATKAIAMPIAVPTARCQTARKAGSPRVSASSTT